jgi:CheY-like chemotaxis protein
LDEKQQKLAVRIDDAIPRILIADDQRLAQVITNLLGNAVKFTPEHGFISLDARCAGEKDDLYVIEVAVSDNGIGISGEQQEHLFTSFQQAESTIARRFGGSGLGLKNRKNIVEMMDGTIGVQSEPGKGSVFTFTIQAKKSAHAHDETDPLEQKYAEKEKPDIAGLYAGHRILLVEDMEINREIVLMLLKPTQLEIDCAENGAEAVYKFSAAPDRYDLIFMDLQMPVMDGYEATRRIRALETEKWEKDVTEFSGKTPGQLLKGPKGVPIIAMTANVFKDDIEKCLQAGMDGHVGKPLDFDVVLAMLKSYLNEVTQFETS